MLITRRDWMEVSVPMPTDNIVSGALRRRDAVKHDCERAGRYQMVEKTIAWEREETGNGRRR